MRSVVENYRDWDIGNAFFASRAAQKFFFFFEILKSLFL
jgi:hypothetical protein